MKKIFGSGIKDINNTIKSQTPKREEIGEKDKRKQKKRDNTG